jgi:putative lipoprotein
MRTVTGRVLLPPDAPALTAPHATIEVRDVSEADAPSQVVAEQHLDNVALRPNGAVPFSLTVPDPEPGRTLAFRVHIDVHGTGITESGDLLTTQMQTVPPSSSPTPVDLQVVVI